MTLLALLTAAHAASVTLNPGDDVGALTSSLGPGDVITFNAGTYTLEERLYWSAVGTEDAPVRFVAAQGAEVVLEGAFSDYIVQIADSSFIEVEGLTLQGVEAEETNPGGLRISNSNDVRVTGLEIRDMRRTSVYLAGDTSNITITGCHIHSSTSGSGIYAGCGDASCWTQGTLIAENWIHDHADERGYGVGIDNGGQGNVIRDNNIYNIGYIGLVVASTEYGEPNTIEGNAIWSLGSHGLYAGGAGRVRNNVIFNAQGYGIYARNNRDALEDLVISHNTVADTVDYGVRLEDWAGRSGMVFANNAVTNPTGRAFYAEGDDIDDSNYISANVMTGLVQGLDILLGHFLIGQGYGDFADAEGWDFYPSSGSNLIAAGDPSGDAWVPAVDFNGLERDGAAPDVGAYERAGADNPGWVVKEGFKDLEADSSIDPGKQVGGCCSDEGSGDSGQAALLLPLLALGWRRRRRG